MDDLVRRIRTTTGDKQIDYEALANLPVSDPTLKVKGAFADARAVGEAIAGKVNIPTTEDGLRIPGMRGQALVANGDGTTHWVTLPELETDEYGNPIWTPDAVAIKVDKTLKERDMAADAKTVGDTFNKVEEDMREQLERLEKVEYYFESDVEYPALHDEVSDLRIGADGKDYSSAGEAIRGNFVKKVNMPLKGERVLKGDSGQVLVSNGDGSTSWVSIPKFSTDEETGEITFDKGTVKTDKDLISEGSAADAKAVGEAITVINETMETKVALPVNEDGELSMGEDGQLLTTRGNGETEWVAPKELVVDDEGILELV